MHSQGRSGGCVLLACLSMLALTAWQVLQAHHEAAQEQLAAQKLSIQLRWQEGEDSAPVRGSATRQVQAAGLERFSRKGSASILRMRQARENDTQEAMTVSSAASRRSVMDVWDGQQQYIGTGQEQPSGSGSQSSHSSGSGIHGQGGLLSSSDGQLISKSWVQPATAEVSDLTDTGDLPNDFDWQAYLSYYPDLLQSGIYSESQAQQHFLEYGRQEGRIYKRLKVLMHYTACTGLINQHYSHIAAFTLASAIGAELVLPPALQRDSFGSYFSTFKEQNEVTWTPTSLSLLLDVDRVTEEWRAHGMEVHKVRTPIRFHSVSIKVRPRLCRVCAAHVYSSMNTVCCNLMPWRAVLLCHETLAALMTEVAPCTADARAGGAA